MGWPTFWMEPTERAAFGLRRYVRRTGPAPDGQPLMSCAGGFHSAFAWVDEGSREITNRRDVPHDDPRWPAHCDEGCGYAFTPDDYYQQWSETLWRRADTGEMRVLHWKYTPPGVPTAEPGAMWDATWMPDEYRGPDGIALLVRCPRGDGQISTNDWTVDGAATGGGRWTRTGDPRTGAVTAEPSISIGNPGSPGHYHGWLRNGELTDHIG